MLIVGNLLDDPRANSFISLEDANAFLADEQNAQWSVADETAKEAALISASRWMASSLPWCENSLSDDDLARVGYAAARLASATLTGGLWGAEAIGKEAKKYKAGSVEVEYHERGKISGAVAGGKSFPWLYPMLRGLLCPGRSLFADIVRR